MKPGSTKSTSFFIATLVAIIAVVLISWHQRPAADQEESCTAPRKINGLSLDNHSLIFAGDQFFDTVPNRNKRARNLDEAIEELEQLDIQQHIDQAMKSVQQALKQLDANKVQLEVDKALASVNIKEIRQQVEESLSKIDWKQIERSIDEASKVDMPALQKEMDGLQEKMKELGPELKLKMEEAQEKIKEATMEMKDFKTFVDGLEKDGLIDKKAGYTLEHRDGKLFINGKESSTDTYQKYKPFLDKHHRFEIKQSDDDFKMNKGGKAKSNSFA